MSNPEDRIRLPRNPRPLATPQGSDDLFFDSAGKLIHQDASGNREEVGGDAVTRANVAAVLPDAIAEDPAAIIAALSKIEDFDGPGLNLTAADNGKIYRCTASVDIVVVTPEDDPGGPFSVAFVQGNAGGQVVFNAASGTTLQSYNDLNFTAGIHAWASLIRVAANTYNLSGNLT